MKDYKIAITMEMKPDIYESPHRPRFEAYADGDMNSDYCSEYNLRACDFPAGTKITIEYPLCTKCDQNVEICKEDEDCDFDWNNWVEENYS